MKTAEEVVDMVEKYLEAFIMQYLVDESGYQGIPSSNSSIWFCMDKIEISTLS